ncbi:Tetratricopeptide repeat protein 28 [Stylophora pistillata]|uniref:Tetratricopeptide repeat protein 28 n=1 Tax=Stylophora pistillata TaxID=50429 RepID=A0A2B4S837_STYPI|nr:Tetratricopeptide repeat protein 28 [Stylophora pistillata]
MDDRVERQFKTAIEHRHQLCLENAKKVGDTNNQGKSYRNLGNIYHGVGKYETAVEYHLRALEIAREVGKKFDEGRSYCNLGRAYRGLRRFKTAIEYHQRHLAIAEEVEDTTDEAVSYYSSLGWAYHGLGQFKEAIEYHRSHLEITKDMGDKIGEGIAYCTLGKAYRGLGQFQTAIEYHRRHLEISEEVGDKVEQGIGYGNLGCACQGLGQFKKAIKYHLSHLKVSQKVADKAGAGVSYESRQDDITPKNLTRFEWADEVGVVTKFSKRLFVPREFDMLQPISRETEVGAKAGEGESYGNLGNTYQSLGEFKTAMEYHQRQLEISKEVGAKAGEGESYGNLGNTYQSLGEFKTAMEYHQRQLEISKEVGAKAGEGESYGNLGNTYQSLGEFKTAMEYHQRHLEITKEVEKGRAQPLRDLMDTTYQPGDFPGNSGSSVSRSCVPSSTVFIAISGPLIYFWVFFSDHNALLRKLHLNNYRYEDELEFFIEQMTGKTLKEIGARDPITGENPPSDSLKIEEEGNDLNRIDARSSQQSALLKLYNIIVTPIADLILGNEITFVREGPFCLVPYAALEDPKSIHLGESLRIRVLPSLTTLQLINDSPAEFHLRSGALLVGEPCIKEIIYHGRRLRQVPGARKEVEIIGRIFRIPSLTGDMATKDEVLKRQSSVALVHIAAHGKMKTGEVFLAPNTTRENSQPHEKDYLLTMKDVVEAGLRARLVVLSCCRTARGEVMAEGVVGIARTFLGAGARSVLVTLGAIDDEGTQEFMSFFYHALADGKKASEALNQAMKCMRQTETFKEVKHWAPFELIGDDVTLDFKDAQ